MAKITGKEGHLFSGPAKAFDSEESMLTALENDRIGPGDVWSFDTKDPKGVRACRKC